MPERRLIYKCTIRNRKRHFTNVRFDWL